MIMDGLKGVEVIADDILIFGEDDAEARKDHDNNLVAVLDRVMKVWSRLIDRR